MDRGYVKNWRKIKDESWYRKPLIAHLAQHLVREVAHKDHKIIWNKEEMVIKRGQLFTGQYTLAVETGLSRQNVRTALTVLANCQFVTIKSTKRYSIITICNYDRYQDINSKANQETNHPNSDQLTKCQPSANHIQECKECKEEKNISVDFFLEIPKQRERYPDQDLIDQIYDALCSTRRKTRKMADSVWLSILQDWSKYPVAQVEQGIRIYLENEYHLDEVRDLKEEYLLGIIKRHKPEAKKANQSPGTGSALLDKYSSENLTAKIYGG